MEKKTYISDSTIYRYISRKTLPSKTTLERLVDALDGQPEEFLALWEQARADHCQLYEGDSPAASSTSQEPPPDTTTGPGSAHRWIRTLSMVSGRDEDVVIRRLAETIISLTFLMDEMGSLNSIDIFRRARAKCWLELSAYIDASTPTGQLCSAACRQAGEVDQLGTIS